MYVMYDVKENVHLYHSCAFFPGLTLQKSLGCYKPPIVVSVAMNNAETETTTEGLK